MPRAIPVADPIDLYIGQRLRAERIARKMSQTDVGAALNVSFQQIQKYERGDNRVSASMLMKAAEAFDLSVADFFPAGKISTATARRVEIGAFRGGATLSAAFVAMTPAQRQILIQVACEFARQPGADEPA